MLIFFALTYFLASAQVEGIKLYASSNYFWLESKIQEELFSDSPDIKFENGDYGYDIGYGFMFRLSDKFLLGTDFNYSDRYRNHVDLASNLKQTVKYVGLHPKMYYKVNKSFKLYFGFGANYLILKRSFTDFDINSDRSFYSNWDTAIHTGFSIRISSFEIFTDFHYGLNPQRKILPLVSIDSELEVNSKSRFIRLGLAYIIKDQDKNSKKKNSKKRKSRYKRR